MAHVILIRYGEMALKGKNRPEFEDRLRERIRLAIQDLALPGARVVKEFGRLFVYLPEGEPGPALDRLQRVFGVVSLSPAREVAAALPEIIGAAAEAAQRALAARHHPGPVPFRVTAHRADKQFPLTSMELAVEVGGALLQRFPQLKVSLKEPEVEVAVEVRAGRAYVFSETIPGPGGLPYGSSGRGCLLLSGGIDSPVAGWMAMKRGVKLEPIHFHSFPFTSERAREKVLDLARVLAGWGAPMKVHLVSVTEIQKALRQHCPESLHITVLRRFMLRIAERVARRAGALALVTGESVGQVASQTLESMLTINEVTSFPILRPLAGMDKAEVMELARRIGTYDLSILPYEDCCTLFVPKNPRTRPRPEEARAAERHLDVEALVEEALAGTETVLVRPGGESRLPAGDGGLMLPIDS